MTLKTCRELKNIIQDRVVHRNIFRSHLANELDSIVVRRFLQFPHYGKSVPTGIRFVNKRTIRESKHVLGFD